jgi:hypothetical protein
MNPKMHCCARSSPPLDVTLSQFHTVMLYLRSGLRLSFLRPYLPVDSSSSRIFRQAYTLNIMLKITDQARGTVSVTVRSFFGRAWWYLPFGLQGDSKLLSETPIVI